MRNSVRWIFATSTLRRDDWRWQQLGQNGEVLKRSRGKFHFLLQCIADARKHGYKPDADMTHDADSPAHGDDRLHFERMSRRRSKDSGKFR